MWPCKWRMQLNPSWLQHSKCGHGWERSPILQFTVTFSSAIESTAIISIPEISHIYHYSLSYRWWITFLIWTYYFGLNMLLEETFFQHSIPLEVHLSTSIHRQNTDRKAWQKEHLIWHHWGALNLSLLIALWVKDWGWSIETSNSEPVRRKQD